MRREARHVQRQLTPAEKARVAAARLQLEQGEKAEIMEQAKRYKREADAERATLLETLQILKAERQRQGLSLAEIQIRTGIEPPNLSRLENDTDANPTIATLMRYAEALGKRLSIILTDGAATKSPTGA